MRHHFARVVIVKTVNLSFFAHGVFATRVASLMQRAFDLAMPSQCALCGNMSQGVVCRGCDAQYWNEPRLRCATCALPLTVEYARHEHDDARTHCADCLNNPPAFNAMLTLADYRAPLDMLTVELKFRTAGGRRGVRAASASGVRGQRIAAAGRDRAGAAFRRCRFRHGA